MRYFNAPHSFIYFLDQISNRNLLCFNHSDDPVCSCGDLYNYYNETYIPCGIYTFVDILGYPFSYEMQDSLVKIGEDWLVVHLNRPLGSGQHATVFAASNLKDYDETSLYFDCSKFCAMKIISYENLTLGDHDFHWKLIQSENDSCRAVFGTNHIGGNCLSYFMDDGSSLQGLMALIGMPLSKGISLFNFKESNSLSFYQTLKIIIAIIEKLINMQTIKDDKGREFFHLDLSLNNILLALLYCSKGHQNFKVDICDFGIASPAYYAGLLCFAGNLGTLAPEVKLNGIGSLSFKIYSFALAYIIGQLFNISPGKDRYRYGDIVNDPEHFIFSYVFNILNENKIDDFKNKIKIYHEEFIQKLNGIAENFKTENKNATFDPASDKFTFPIRVAAQQEGQQTHLKFDDVLEAETIPVPFRGLIKRQLEKTSEMNPGARCSLEDSLTFFCDINDLYSCLIKGTLTKIQSALRKSETFIEIPSFNSFTTVNTEIKPMWERCKIKTLLFNWLIHKLGHFIRKDVDTINSLFPKFIFLSLLVVEFDPYTNRVGTSAFTFFSSVIAEWEAISGKPFIERASVTLFYKDMNKEIGNFNDFASVLIPTSS